MGRARPEPITLNRNPNGTFTLPSGGPARTYPSVVNRTPGPDQIIDGHARYEAMRQLEGDRTAPRPVSRLDRQLQIRAALAGNELVLVDGEFRIRRQR